MSTAYISIGSNLGNRLKYVRETIRRMEQSKEIKISKASSVYETQPVEYKDQPWFLNMVLELETSLEPLNLLELLLNIEDQMGRKRNQKYGPRNIDLDLLFYDDLVLNSDKLTLPHPRMHERRFVLVPLAEIAPQVVHPLLKKNVKRLLDDLSTDTASRKEEFEVRLYSERALKVKQVRKDCLTKNLCGGRRIHPALRPETQCRRKRIHRERTADGGRGKLFKTW